MEHQNGYTDGTSVNTQPEFNKNVPQTPHVASSEHVVGNSSYDSNPFVASVGGLVMILKTNPVAALAVSLLVILLIMAAAVVLFPLSFLISGSAIGKILLILLVASLTLAVVPLLMGANFAIAASSIKGDRLSTTEAVRLSFSKILTNLGLIILLAFLGGFGLLLLIVPGLIFLVRSSLAPLIVFTEDAGAISAIKKSIQLTKGHFFETLGSIIAGGLLVSNGLLGPAAGVSAATARYKQYKSIPANSTKSNVHWLNYFISILLFVIIAIYITTFALGIKYGSNTSTTIQNNTNTLYQNNTNNTDFNNSDYFNNLYQTNTQ